jgi:hypothetical protein
MQKFFFDMKDGVPLRDRTGIDFKGNLEAIAHCKELAQHFRDDSLRDDQDLEISVVNADGKSIASSFTESLNDRPYRHWCRGRRPFRTLLRCGFERARPTPGHAAS